MRRICDARSDKLFYPFPTISSQFCPSFTILSSAADCRGIWPADETGEGRPSQKSEISLEELLAGLVIMCE